jgi:hypothetical protein
MALVSAFRPIFADSTIPSPYAYFSDSKDAALTEAAMKGDLATIDQSIKEGGNPNAISKDGLPIIVWVLFAKNQEGFKALLDHHANPEAAIKHRLMPPSVLELTAEILPTESYWFEQLIMHGASPNFVVAAPEKRTIIYDTILYDREDLTIFLIRHGADINHRDIINETPLVSTLSGLFRIKETLALLQAGADWKPTNKRGKGLIDYLLIIAQQTKPENHAKPWWHDYVTVVQWLSDHGAAIPDELKALVPELKVPKKP